MLNNIIDKCLNWFFMIHMPVCKTYNTEQKICNISISLNKKNTKKSNMNSEIGENNDRKKN